MKHLSEPFSDASHVSLKGEVLHIGLHNVYEVACMKRAYKISVDFLQSDDIKDDNFMHHPVYITEEKYKQHKKISEKKTKDCNVHKTATIID